MSREQSTSTRVRAFLSCSIRQVDRPLVGALVRYVLEPMGFDCVTIGRNVSAPDQVDDVIRSYIENAHCLIGVATRRLVASDAAYPDRTLVLATSYLQQEAAAAHQIRLPLLMVKTPEVALQGVTARNLYLEVESELSSRGRVQFKGSKELVLSSLRELRTRATALSQERDRKDLVAGIKTGATLVAGGYGLIKFIDWLQRPECFGDYYYRDRACRDCAFRADCQVEKVRQRST